MKVILLQNIKGFGRTGDIKNVSDGYARNFLLPKNMAKSATEGALKEAETLKKKLEATSKIEREKAAEFSQKLNSASIEFIKKASKTGKLFSSVTKEDIAEELSKLAGGKIEEGLSNLGNAGEHIKQIGEYLAEAELTEGVKTPFKIHVKAMPKEE